MIHPGHLGLAAGLELVEWNTLINVWLAVAIPKQTRNWLLQYLNQELAVEIPKQTRNWLQKCLKDELVVEIPNKTGIGCCNT